MRFRHHARGTYDIIRAVCMAAEELRPLLYWPTMGSPNYLGHDWFYETAKWMASKVSVPERIWDCLGQLALYMEMLKLIHLHYV